MVSHGAESVVRPGEPGARVALRDAMARHWETPEPGAAYQAGPVPDVQALRSPALRRLRAVVLLGGTLRVTALRGGIDRSVLDLPVEPGRTLLAFWREQCIHLAETLGMRGMAVRLVLDRAASEPRHGWVADQRVMLVVERDPVEYRGTGGVLRDLAECYDKEDYLLIGNAAQLLRSPLPALAAALAATDAEVAVIAHEDGTPSGLMLARCGCLREIPSSGFIDMKEQSLPAIARRHRVEVVQRQHPSGLPLHTLADYIEALRRHHGEMSGDGADPAYAEDWKPIFSLVEFPDDVHPRARIHNSVVLKGGRVEEGAVVVGSVVCPGAVVRRGTMVADELVTANRGR